MKLSNLLLAAALSMPMSAMAEYSYSYLEFGYRHNELAGDLEGDGFDLEVNFLLGEMLFFSANMDEVEYVNDLQLDRFGLGIGAHFNAFKNIDIYGVLSYEDLEFDIPGATDFDDTGTGLEIGARYKWDDNWEFKVAGDFAKYEDDDFDIESRFFVGTAVYHLSSNYAILGEYMGGEMDFDKTGASLEENNVKIAVRFQF